MWSMYESEKWTLLPVYGVFFYQLLVFGLELRFRCCFSALGVLEVLAVELSLHYDFYGQFLDLLFEVADTLL